jgi:hypothetical protein
LKHLVSAAVLQIFYLVHGWGWRGLNLDFFSGKIEPSGKKDKRVLGINLPGQIQIVEQLNLTKR